MDVTCAPIRLHLWSWAWHDLLLLERQQAIRLGKLSHTPHCFEGARIIFMNPWAIQVFIMNIHNPFMPCATSQYVFEPRDVIMLMRAVTIEFEKYVTTNNFLCWILWTKAISIPFVHDMYVIKARTHGCVRNDSETHETGVTGLHSRLRRSCNPVTQSRAFHCHFAHTRAFLPYGRPTESTKK